MVIVGSINVHDCLYSVVLDSSTYSSIMSTYFCLLIYFIYFSLILKYISPCLFICLIFSKFTSLLNLFLFKFIYFILCLFALLSSV